MKTAEKQHPGGGCYPRRSEEPPNTSHIISHHEADGSVHTLCGEYIPKRKLIKGTLARFQPCAVCEAIKHLTDFALGLA